jgi:hypothetical protein
MIAVGLRGMTSNGDDLEDAFRENLKLRHNLAANVEPHLLGQP